MRVIRGLFSCLLLFALQPALECRAGEITGRINPPNKHLCIDLFGGNEDAKFPEYLRDTELDPKTGKFAFKDVDAGVYELRIWGDGVRLVPRVISSISMDSGTVDLGLIELDPSAWITGSVEPYGEGVEIAASEDMASVQIDEDGRFEVTGLPSGKYEIKFSQDCYIPRTVEVEVSRPREYKLGVVRLDSLGGISGSITVQGKPLAEYMNVYEELHVGVSPSSDTTINKKLEHFNNKSDSVLFTPSVPMRYSIEGLRPGRYDLSVMGPGFLVLPMSDLPENSATEDDQAAARELIQTVGEAFSKADLETVRQVASSDCRLDRYPVADFNLDKEDSRPRSIGNREFLIIRASSEAAVAYTRGQLPPPKDEAGMVSEWKPDAVEMWHLKREDAHWKLSSYAYDPQLSSLVNMLRMSLSQIKGLENAPSGYAVPPRCMLMLTDDPKLINIQVKTGEITTGRDFTVELRQ